MLDKEREDDDMGEGERMVRHEVKGDGGKVRAMGGGSVWIGVEVDGLVESRCCATIATMMDISLLMMPAVGRQCCCVLLFP